MCFKQFILRRMLTAHIYIYFFNQNAQIRRTPDQHNMLGRRGDMTYVVRLANRIAKASGQQHAGLNVTDACVAQLECNSLM